MEYHAVGDGDWSAGLWQFLASAALIVMLALLVRRLPLAATP